MHSSTFPQDRSINHSKRCATIVPPNNRNTILDGDRAEPMPSTLLLAVPTSFAHEACYFPLFPNKLHGVRRNRSTFSHQCYHTVLSSNERILNKQLIHSNSSSYLINFRHPYAHELSYDIMPFFTVGVCTHCCVDVGLTHSIHNDGVRR